jgi:hypothetical protein
LRDTTSAISVKDRPFEFTAIGFTAIIKSGPRYGYYMLARCSDPLPDAFNTGRLSVAAGGARELTLKN